MAKIVRSRQAQRDVAEVLAFTKERWGIAKAREYRELIREALETIASDPECGTRRFTARPEIWGYHIRRPGRAARHIIFYRIGVTGSVQIVRLLHDSMDFDRHFPNRTRYRVVAFDGAGDGVLLERLWDDFATLPTVEPLL